MGREDHVAEVKGMEKTAYRRRRDAAFAGVNHLGLYLAPWRTGRRGSRRALCRWQNGDGGAADDRG